MTKINIGSIIFSGLISTVIRKFEQSFFRKEMYMKKTIKFISIGLLSAAIAATASISVFAAGINTAEQKILDELRTSVDMEGNSKYLPGSYINQAENYFNTIEISDADADTIISKIESTKTFLTGTGAVNYDGLTDAQIDEFIVKCNDIVGVIDLKLFYDKATRTVTIVDADGKTVFSASNVGYNADKSNDKAKDNGNSGNNGNNGNSGSNSGNNGGNSGSNGSNSGNNGGNGSGTVVDDNPIKRTGIDFNIPGVTSVAGTGVLLVSAAGVCLIKKKKSAVREDA